MLFLYSEPEGDGLQQGDLIRRTAEIEAVLREYHQHYFDTDSYRYFVVLTQSCDLVRRPTQCKSRYISLAAVRPAILAIERELHGMLSELERRSGLCRESVRGRLKDFLIKLYNNNEPRYFYFPADPAIGLQEAHCAFLPLSIAIRAREHYQKCVAARTASLKPVFQAKLGWLVGNLYSRVGTPDWVPEAEEADAFDDRLKEQLDALATWMDDRHMDAARKAINTREIRDLAPEALQRRVQEAKPKSRKQSITDALTEALRNQELLGPSALSGQQIQDVLRYLGSISEFKRASDG
ncbi:MAG: hypothetical protein IPJ41_00310 [Phycisphaerales bacterium]|nr:hypothetical protein [Phycisphaerales bacterium]